MPFGVSYNEAANPRVAPVRAWLTAATTTVIWPTQPHVSHNCQTPAYKPSKATHNVTFGVLGVIFYSSGLAKRTKLQPIKYITIDASALALARLPSHLANTSHRFICRPLLANISWLSSIS